MNVVELVGTGVLILLMGGIFPARAQEGRREHEGRPSGGENLPAEKTRPETRGQGELHRRWQTNRPPKLVPPGPGGHGLWRGRRAQDWRAEHHTWQERGGYKGFRIPPARYGRNFGSNHFFRIHSRPVSMLGGFISFQYGGFGFSVIDPWPEYWSDDWYDTDEVYIYYSEDGYYLHNRRYPEDRIAINVRVN